MEDRYNGTVTAILEAGKKEFLTYGYEKASLRRIAKEASVTTGAIYGYFPGKKALFDALTSDTAEELLDLYRKEHRDFAALPPEQQPARLNEITEQYIPWMVNISMIILRCSSCFCAAAPRKPGTVILTGWPRWRSSPAGIL